MSRKESKRPRKSASEEKPKLERKGKLLTIEEFRKEFPNHPLLQPNTIIIGDLAKMFSRRSSED